MTVTTPKKRAANRANAAKSTGPRTPEAKRPCSVSVPILGLVQNGRARGNTLLFSSPRGGAEELAGGASPR